MSSLPAKISPFFFLSCLVLLVVGGLAVNYTFKTSSLETESQLLESKVAELTTKTQDLESKGVASALSASGLIAQIDQEYVQWSKVIQRIQNVVPKNSRNEHKVSFLSYSGGRDGKLTLTTKTISGSQDPYQDTADLLRAFNGSEYFAEAFLPGINKVTLDNGSEVLSYVLQMNFKKELVDEATTSTN